RLPCQTSDHVLGAFDSAAVKKFLESGVPPLAENILSGKVYGGVAIAQHVLPRPGLHRVAGHDGHAVAELLTCGVASTGQSGARVAAVRQRQNQTGAEESLAPRDEYAHLGFSRRQAAGKPREPAPLLIG